MPGKGGKRDVKLNWKGYERVRSGINLCEARRQFSRAAVHILFLSLQLASRATPYPIAFVLECVHGLFLSLVVLWQMLHA